MGVLFNAWKLQVNDHASVGLVDSVVIYSFNHVQLKSYTNEYLISTSTGIVKIYPKISFNWFIIIYAIALSTHA